MTKQDRIKKKLYDIACIAVGLIFAIAVSFAIVAGIVFGVCWAFKLNFSLRISFGVWLILVALGFGSGKVRLR